MHTWLLLYHAMLISFVAAQNFIRKDICISSLFMSEVKSESEDARCYDTSVSVPGVTCMSYVSMAYSACQYIHTCMSYTDACGIRHKKYCNCARIYYIHRGKLCRIMDRGICIVIRVSILYCDIGFTNRIGNSRSSLHARMYAYQVSYIAA